MESCNVCGFEWDLVPVEEMPARIEQAHRHVRALLGCGAQVQSRPDADRWSAVEYAAHIRDVTLNLRDRIVMGLAVEVPSESPPMSMYPAFRVSAGLYESDTASAIGDELRTAASLFGRLVATVDPPAWGRTMPYPWPRPTQRPLSWIAAQVVHENEHHCRDIADNLAMGRDHLLHVMPRVEWEHVAGDDLLTDSSRGRTLADEGFIHLCTAAQVDGVVQRYYGDLVDELMVLQVDPSALSPGALRFEVVGDAAFPHLYEPLPRAAVTSVGAWAPGVALA